MQNTLRIAPAVGFLGLVLGSGCGGPVGDAPDPTASELTIDQADPAAFRAHLTVAEQQVLLSSDVGAGVDPLTGSANVTRTTTIASVDGQQFAVWVSDVDTLETSGSYGDATFGHAADAPTDHDVSRWQDVASSYAGRVVAAVARSARALADSGSQPALKSEIDEVASMGDTLAQMAGEIRVAESAGVATRLWFDKSHGKLIDWHASTTQSGAVCCVIIYQEIRPDVWSQNRGCGTGRVQLNVSNRTYSSGITGSAYSKHWTSRHRQAILQCQDSFLDQPNCRR